MNSLYAFPWPPALPPVHKQPKKTNPPKKKPSPKQPVYIPVPIPIDPSSPWDQ